ncbi:MAG: hypothetical protein Ct9H300mP31_00240 [Acidimicrobiaceae bacterium]|nr:MAG: hypothetical protein Ct9H300mP31_00240 [Acidimicrobiaceae bacterium]
MARAVKNAREMALIPYQTGLPRSAASGGPTTGAPALMARRPVRPHRLRVQVTRAPTEELEAAELLNRSRSWRR